MSQRQSDKSVTPATVELLLARPIDLDRPEEMWLAVRDVYAETGARPVEPDEAHALYRTIVEQWPDSTSWSIGLPDDWQWRVYETCRVVHAAVDGEPIHVLRALSSLRQLLIVRDYRLERYGDDYFDGFRMRLIDWLVRVVGSLEPDEWEQELMQLPRAEPEAVLSLGDRIRRRRRRLGMTQGQLALRIGVDRATIVRWEKGERAPSLANARALVRELGGSVPVYRDS